MNSSCSSWPLQQLLDSELTPSDETLEHLEHCADCQQTLQHLSADDLWWDRVGRCLQHAPIDEHLQVREDNHPWKLDSIETLLIESNSSTAVSDRNAAALLDAPVHPEMLGRLDEFDIEQQIGRGGMGVVFRGFDRSLNRPVALKLMSPHLGASPSARQRFTREAQAAAAVVHPHVVPIYRVSSTDDRPYIAMALIDGRSLQEEVAAQGPFRVDDVVRIAIQIAGGLAAAHQQGLVHRDIKPANILMERDVCRVMITDFGLARAIDDVAMTQSGCLAGTPHYMSPEQATGADVDARSDLFSLGSVMFYLLTGQEPFQADYAFAVIHQIVQEPPGCLRSLAPDTPEVLCRIVDRLLEKAPDDRPPSAQHVQETLTELLAHLQSPQNYSQPTVDVCPTEQRRHFRNRLRRTVIVLMGTLVLAAGLLLGLQSGNKSPVGNSTPHIHRDLHEHGEHNEHESHEPFGESHHGHE